MIDIQLLLGQTKIESTARYLDVEIDDALAIAEQVDIWKHGWNRNVPPCRSWVQSTRL